MNKLVLHIYENKMQGVYLVKITACVKEIILIGTLFTSETSLQLFFKGKHTLSGRLDRRIAH